MSVVFVTKNGLGNWRAWDQITETQTCVLLWSTDCRLWRATAHERTSGQHKLMSNVLLWLTDPDSRSWHVYKDSHGPCHIGIPWILYLKSNGQIKDNPVGYCTSMLNYSCSNKWDCQKLKRCQIRLNTKINIFKTNIWKFCLPQCPCLICPQSVKSDICYEFHTNNSLPTYVPSLFSLSSNQLFSW